MAPFLYLDIDGVLNDSRNVALHPPEDVLVFRGGDYVLARHLSLFTEFWRRNRPNIVVVSSWAIAHDVADISAFLGIPLHGRVSYCGGGMQRGDSVARHVEQHGVVRYGVLDDAGDRCYANMERVVAPDGSAGITPEDLERLAWIMSTGLVDVSTPATSGP